MHGRNNTTSHDSPELRAQRMYQRVIAQWAGDYLVCRSIWTQQHNTHTGPSAGSDRFAPAIWEIGED